MANPPQDQQRARENPVRSTKLGEESGSSGTSSYGRSEFGHHGEDSHHSDEQVQELVNERLQDDPRIDAHAISVSVRSGEITLEGSVESAELKSAVENIAAQFGVREVRNNLRVR